MKVNKMFNILRHCVQQHTIKNTLGVQSVRTFLSPAYYCNEVWDRRLNSPILQKVNVDEFFYELDQRYQKTKELSAVDVDLFVNAIKNEYYVEELLDILHKLRLTAETCNTLSSTNHGAVRLLMQYGTMENLANVLDDRLNYGIFLDFYTANILMDMCWKKKDFVSGSRIASQLMLQEDFDHPISTSLSLLHCYNYLLNPNGWPEYEKPEEPEEEVKVRVKFVRNPYFDDHFDLRDPNKIVGKTLAMFTEGKNDSLNRSFNILGNVLFGKEEKATGALDDCVKKGIPLYKEIINLIPPDYTPELLSKIDIESSDVQTLLSKSVEKQVHLASERDIAEQCKIYLSWEDERIKAIELQKQRLSTIKRLQNIESLHIALKEKQTRLWFFENEENIELAIEDGKKVAPQEKKKVKKTNDENYIPPEIR
ncbi:28S ribosomal protein S27, mitochondrial-like [Diorhabda carinulata]|uniref:28S ribosomal protein S27, mitochondrial-like n=1 Tax=Diorhabda carinulata TaxID=1163345 RepID=UPI0025A0BCC7|nr:28S ribosomal protein S27, mitochondrial-like [Diorhabda carinulata]